MIGTQSAAMGFRARQAVETGIENQQKWKMEKSTTLDY